jgi:hypothetical protein
MYQHATIPGLPERLWQAAFYLDMVRAAPAEHRYAEEVQAMAERLSRQADEVIAWRKKKLGW